MPTLPHNQHLPTITAPIQITTQFFKPMHYTPQIGIHLWVYSQECLKVVRIIIWKQKEIPERKSWPWSCTPRLKVSVKGLSPFLWKYSSGKTPSSFWKYSKRNLVGRRHIHHRLRLRSRYCRNGSLGLYCFKMDWQWFCKGLHVDWTIAWKPTTSK